jgi:hypothetical protein
MLIVIELDTIAWRSASNNVMKPPASKCFSITARVWINFFHNPYSHTKHNTIISKLHIHSSYLIFIFIVMPSQARFVSISTTMFISIIKRAQNLENSATKNKT